MEEKIALYRVVIHMRDEESSWYSNYLLKDDAKELVAKIVTSQHKFFNFPEEFSVLREMPCYIAIDDISVINIHPKC
jgi:hypothetical protein